MRRCYWSGTRNTPRKILENYYSRVLYDFHGFSIIFSLLMMLFSLFSHNNFGRKRDIRIAPATRSTRVRDSLVISKEGDVYEVYGSSENPWNAYKVKVEEFNPNIVGLPLPWKKVGVHRYSTFFPLFQASSYNFCSFFQIC